MISFLVLILVAIAVGVGLLAYRHRPESSIESGIRSFRREMRALAPPSEPGRRRTDAPGTPVQPERRGQQHGEPPAAGVE